MPFRGRQVNQPPFAQQVDFAPIAQCVLVHKRTHAARLAAQFFQSGDIDFHVEMAGISHQRPILHHREVFPIQHVDVPRRRDKYVANRRRLYHGHDTEAIHHRFQRLQRINLRDNHVAAQPFGAHGDAAAAPPITGDDHGLAGNQIIRRPDHPIQRRLPRAIPVVKHMLGHGVVHRNHGEHQLPALRHSPQPDHARRRLLRAAHHAAQQFASVLVQLAHQIRPIIHGDVRAVVQSGLQMFVIRGVILALNGKDRDFIMGHQRRRHVVLGTQRIAGAQHHVRAPLLQRRHQVSRFCSHVQAGGDANPVQRFLLGKLLPDAAQHRHLLLRPINTMSPPRGQLYILNVEFHDSFKTPLKSRAIFPNRPLVIQAARLTRRCHQNSAGSGSQTPQA